MCGQATDVKVPSLQQHKMHSVTEDSTIFVLVVRVFFFVHLFFFLILNLWI